MVSNTMGLYPNDKIYVFVMNLFTAVQFATFRAYYKKMSTIISPQMNNLLFFIGMVTCIAGPVLALFDYTPVDPKEPEDDSIPREFNNHLLSRISRLPLYLQSNADQ